MEGKRWRRRRISCADKELQKNHPQIFSKNGSVINQKALF